MYLQICLKALETYQHNNSLKSHDQQEDMSLTFTSAFPFKAFADLNPALNRVLEVSKD